MATHALPSWAVETVEDGIPKVLVDVDVAYPAVLAELAMSANQYSVSVAQQCCLLEVKEAMGGECWIRMYSSSGSDKFAVRKLPISVPHGAYGDEAGRAQGPTKWAELKAAREKNKQTTA
jgi:hypothetical protein